ncbi:putative efflux protein, MATE family [Hathewaya proteolytica DSM 3090]|uniref:Probable multidrug resistance protein NorM n=1 Tax=Hathewaya proteolytica DSM 3090 TaxID=1121331 RepID=A0A1M6QBE2_9CLOT|nr:MATE family efflux transporter [Hathewaya proteolytica]SHK17614.1 putative efflux protein, MATE family [Hathewaya proteolytica DSM 3090]
MNSLYKLFSVEYLMRKVKKKGELPSTAEVYKEVLNISAPSVADAVLVALISMVDTIMVSSLGSGAIAAVGITGQPRMIILSVFMALNVGLTSVIARRKGQNNQKEANSILNQIITICILLSIIIATLGAVYARPLLVFAGANNEIVDSAVAYFEILMVGIPFNVITFCINGAQRGCGNTKISMKINVVSNLVNMLLNYFLITGHLGFPALGIRGAAIATVIGNLVGFIMAIISLTSKKENFLRININQLFKFKLKSLKSVFSIGISAGVEQIFFRIGFFLYTKVIASLGTTALATNMICSNLTNLSFAFYDGLSMATGALFGQAMGKERQDISQLYVNVSIRIGFIISCVIIFVFVVFGRSIIGLFSDDNMVLSLGYIILLEVAVTQPIQSSQYIYSSALRSAGDARYTAFTTMISVGILRPIEAYVLCYPLGLGLAGVWMSYFMDQGIRYLLCKHRFQLGGWKKIRV